VTIFGSGPPVVLEGRPTAESDAWGDSFGYVASWRDTIVDFAARRAVPRPPGCCGINTWLVKDLDAGIFARTADGNELRTVTQPPPGYMFRVAPDGPLRWVAR